MLRIIPFLSALILVFCAPAYAQVINALPYNFTNGSLADASQVMANYNEIVTDVNTNAAHNGANSDITSITGLTTALAPTYGGTVVYTGSTTTGSANAHVLAAVVPTAFTLTAGNFITGIAGFTNTGATTLNVNGTGVTAMRKITPAGLAALSGNEIITGGQYTWMFDGTFYQLLNPVFHGVLLNVQVFDTPGAITYTPTTGMKNCIIKMQGGGGASGGSTGAGGQSAASGPAGGGDYVELLATAAQIGANAPGVVGAGGTAGSAGNNPGNAGADTTVTIGGGTTWKAGGGSPGSGQASSAGAQAAGSAGAGGTKTNGTNATLLLDVPGQAGDGSGFSNGAVTTIVHAGTGGNSFLGHGGPATNSAANAGVNFGGGAGAGLNASGGSVAGAAGAQGKVTVMEFQ